MEIYCQELEYGILYHKLLQLSSDKRRHRRKMRYTGTNCRDYLPWMKNVRVSG